MIMLYSAGILWSMAITLTALQEAHVLGLRYGVLGSSDPGYSVYQRLGFKEYCQIGIYEWHPPQARMTLPGRQLLRVFD
jgi:hypothetical protein